MSNAYDIWYKRYHDEGEKLRTHEVQFGKRVTEWGRNEEDPRLPKAQYDHLQSGIRYNDFIQNEGSRINADIAKFEEALKTPDLPAAKVSQLQHNIAELHDRHQAWTDVLIDAKHEAVNINEVRYEGKIYSMYRDTRWDKTTVNGLVQSGLEWAGEKAHNIKENLTPSQQTKQDACNAVANAAVGHMVPNLAGGGMSGALFGEAQGEAMKGGPAESCRRTFETNDDFFRDAGALNTHGNGADAQLARTDLPFNGRALSSQEQQWDQALDKHITPKLQAEGYSDEQIANVKTGCMLQMNNTCPDRDLQFAGINPKFGKEGMVVMGIHNSYYTPTADLAATRDTPPDQQIHQMEQQQELQRQQQVAVEHSHSGPVRTM